MTTHTPEEEVYWLQVKYRIPPQMAQLLRALLHAEILKRDDIEQPFNPHRCIATAAHVAMHRLRKRMIDHDIYIYNQKLIGWWLEAEDKAKIRDELRKVQVAFAA
jgi:hypothetical protein